MLKDRDLVDPSTGITHRRGANPTTLHPRSSIRKLLDDLTASFQNREDNMARLEAASNHKLEFIENIHVKFYVIPPPLPPPLSARHFVPTPKKSANKGAIIYPKNKDDKCFFICCRNICFS